MPGVRKILAAAAIIAVAAVGGFALAQAVSTDGPDPKVDKPVVVRPAGGSDDRSPDDRSSGPGANGASDDKNKNRDDNSGPGGSSSGDGRDDDRDDDDLTPVNPTPGTFDDDDDDHGDDDGDDDGGDD